MRENDQDKRFAIGRLIRSATGLAIIGLGAFVFVRSPEHGAGYAIVLTTIGGVLFDHTLVSRSNIRRILEK